MNIILGFITILSHQVFSLTQKNYSFYNFKRSTTPQCGPIPNYVCQFQGRECPEVNKFIEIPCSADFRNWAETAHNFVRNKFARGGDCRNGNGQVANMMRLKYDIELERTAACSLTRCILRHDECDSRKFGPVGMNVYKCIGSNADRLLYSAVNTWFSEIVDVKNETTFHFGSVQGKMIEHFTQLVWAQTCYVGCARARNPQTSEYYLACHYAPTGNIPGKAVYLKGNGASACPAGSKRSCTYPALCEHKGIRYTCNGTTTLKNLGYYQIIICLLIIFLINFVFLS